MLSTRPIRALFGAFDILFFLHLCSELEKQSEIRLSCVLQRGTEILELASKMQPDVLLMEWGRYNDYETMRTTCAQTKVILFLDGDQGIVDALEHGVRGCLPKNCSTELCVRAIRAVHDGDMWVGRKALAQLLDSLRAQLQPADEVGTDSIPGLTTRESEVVVKIRLGLTNKEVARQLGISETTVKTHLQHVFHKLGISRRADLWRGAVYSAAADQHLMG